MFNVSFPQLLKEYDSYKASTKTKLRLEKQYAKEAAKVFEQSLVRQYVEDDTHQTVWRLSQVGRQPALEILARHFGVIPLGGSQTVTPQQRYLFHVGDTFEAWVVFTLKRLGYSILESQSTVNYCGIGGHIDFLLVVQGLINKFDFLFLIMDLCLASLVMHLFLINALTDFTPGLRSIFLLGLFFLII